MWPSLSKIARQDAGELIRVIAGNDLIDDSRHLIRSVADADHYGDGLLINEGRLAVNRDRQIGNAVAIEIGRGHCVRILITVKGHSRIDVIALFEESIGAGRRLAEDRGASSSGCAGGGTVIGQRNRLIDLVGGENTVARAVEIADGQADGTFTDRKIADLERDSDAGIGHGRRRNDRRPIRHVVADDKRERLLDAAAGPIVDADFDLLRTEVVSGGRPSNLALVVDRHVRRTGDEQIGEVVVVGVAGVNLIGELLADERFQVGNRR